MTRVRPFGASGASKETLRFKQLCSFVQTQRLAEALRSRLLLDAESVYPLVANPLLLLLARVILVKCSSRMVRLQVGVSLCRGGAARWFLVIINPKSSESSCLYWSCCHVPGVIPT